MSGSRGGALLAPAMYRDSPAIEFYRWARTAEYRPWLKASTMFWSDPFTTLQDIAELGKLDRYFLLVYLLDRTDVLHPWVYERCREVEAEPDGYLDLWSRWHFKSSIITYAGSIQELLKDPEIKIAIFSVKLGVSKPFLKQIKRTLESNAKLKRLYPDILYDHPAKQSPQWSETGIVVKREGTAKEPTVSAHGLVDALPTGGHFDLRIYDDVVTEKSVTTPDMIQKTTEALELSWSLGTHDDQDREWYIGTRYAFGDTYQVLESRGVVKVRRYPATDNGGIDGKPVLMSPEKWRDLVKKTSLRVLSCQQLLDPRKGSDITFDIERLQYYEVRPLTLNVYIMVDPARTKKKSSARTGIAVVGVDAAFNKYLLDGLCHRLTLSERWTWMKHFRAKWMKAPGVQYVKVGYEIYGAHADMEHFQEMMRLDGSQWPIEELKWHRDAPDAHVDRVQRLEPDMHHGRFFLPYGEYIDPQAYKDRGYKAEDVHGRHKAGYFVKSRKQKEFERGGSAYLVATPIIARDESGDTYNLTEWFIANEMCFFPNIHVDFLDALSRIYDMEPVPPATGGHEDLIPPPEPDR